MTTTITFTFEDRTIRSGEFRAAFGHGDQIKEKVLQYLPLTKTMEMTSTETSITIKCGKVGEKMKRELQYLSNTGIITDLSLVGEVNFLFCNQPSKPQKPSLLLSDG